MKFFHPSIVPSIGASARLPTIEAAIIMPPVSSPLSDSHAPQPRIAICVHRRTNLEMPATTMLRSCARTCAFRDSAVSRPHMATASGIMPMALMTWALRAMASACRLARVPKALARPNGTAVIFWLR